jgi:putative membrane protein
MIPYTRTLLLLSSLIGAPLAIAGTLHANEPSAASPVSQTDEQFIRKAAVGGIAEVAMAKLATNKAASSQVKQFAERMIVDHGKANQKLETLAASRGVTVSTTLDAEHQKKLVELARESGPTFDMEYMKAQVAGHEKMQTLLEDEAKATKDTSLKTFAEETLPTVEAHHRMAQDVQKEIAVPRASAQ